MPSIIVIDDDNLVRRTLATILERDGHAVRGASNGRDALALIRSEPPDILITDIIMPEMDGISFIREIRASLPAMKILAISGGGRASNLEFLELAKSMGADDILRKPIDRKKLLAAVAALAAV